VTARREFGGAIVACTVGAGLVWLALRAGWARVDYHAPAPLPAGSVRVTGQDLLAAPAALAIAALACLAAIIATRGVARRAAGVLMAGLGVWIAVTVSEPVRAASVIAAAAGSGTPGGYAGSVAGGSSAIAGNSSTGGGLPVLGSATKVVLDSGPWRVAAVIGAVLVIAAGLVAAWHGTRWPVMSARFDRPAPQEEPQPVSEEARQDGDAAELWEALDRGVDLTELTERAPHHTEGQDASAEAVAAHGDDK
jgi:uncharacterized membrane protein (TIGR02234 family)